MQITQIYLERFAIKARKPSEIALNGYEQSATHVINVDDPDGTYLAVSYRDDYPSDAPWDIKEGSDKRETFVVARRGPDAVGSVGYRFAGLVQMDDLRSWSRRKEGLTD